MAPCTQWIDGDDVADCCSVESTSGAIFDTVAEQASDILFELSGRQFPGLCEKTVRPECVCSCGYQILSRGHIIGPWDWGYPWWSFCDFCLVSCEPSLVKLSGYPIREISEVLIDGAALAADQYRVFRNRYAMRLDDGRWPVRQDLTLADTEEGTFSITYSYGADPPALGIAAAAQLGCELYKACNGETCALPAGTTRVINQGITIDKLAFTTWGFQNKEWRTGLSLVDAFLSTYNKAGLMRRPTFHAPGKRQYAQPWQG